MDGAEKILPLQCNSPITNAAADEDEEGEPTPRVSINYKSHAPLQRPQQPTTRQRQPGEERCKVECEGGREEAERRRVEWSGWMMSEEASETEEQLERRLQICSGQWRGRETDDSFVAAREDEGRLVG